jgi:vesicle-fusing ATPase
MSNTVNASNAFEDLSGVSTSGFSNPYDALIHDAGDNPVAMPRYIHRLILTPKAELQARYSTHRSTRNAQQKAKLLDANFPGPSIDPILLRLSDATVEPGYVDPRNCLVFWGRPTQQIRDMIAAVQQELTTVAPSKFYQESKDQN